MDAERRHELEQNTLAQALTKAPALFWEYGAYLLLGIAVIVALYFYFSTRSAAQIQEREGEAASLYNMASAIEQAERSRLEAVFLSPEEIIARQADATGDFRAYENLPATSDRPGVRAHALRLRGDLNWTLATFPEPAPATTQPATQPTTAPAGDAATRPAIDPTTRPVLGGADGLEPPSEELWLDEAEAAYREVVEKYSTHTADVLASLFGLAAVAEQRGEFDLAVTYYDQVIERVDIGEGPEMLARQRKELANRLSLSPRLAPPTAPATRPATQPAEDIDLGPAPFGPTSATTTPATPATPTTAPSTQPATQPAD